MIKIFIWVYNMFQDNRCKCRGCMVTRYGWGYAPCSNAKVPDFAPPPPRTTKQRPRKLKGVPNGNGEILMSNEMTAQELIYMSMVREAIMRDIEVAKYVRSLEGFESHEDLWYDIKSEYDCCWEVAFEFREGIDTNLAPKTSSCHYEIDVVAAKIDGVWVAWDFYYGGGKHGEPESFDWISNARIVECEERVVTKTEYVFKEKT